MHISTNRSEGPEGTLKENMNITCEYMDNIMDINIYRTHTDTRQNIHMYKSGTQERKKRPSQWMTQTIAPDTSR